MEMELVDVKLELGDEFEINETVCRTCLTAGASVSVFGLAVALRKLCGLRVARGDGLPALVCARCDRGLQAAAALQSRALQADRLLRDARQQRLLKKETQSPGADDQWLVVIEEAKHKRPQCKQSPKNKPAARNRKPKDSLQCAVCGQQASKPSALKRHMLSHTGERPFMCSWCSRAFTDAANLRRHEAVHASAPRYTCDACGRGFQRRDDIIVHLRTHSGARPYACTQCSAMFTQTGALSRHQRSHSGVLAFTCPHGGCGKAFANPGQLHKHRLVHSTRRDHVCAACSRSYKSRSSLNLHRALRHAAGNCICTLCRAGFSTATGLQLHTTRNHPAHTLPGTPLESQTLSGADKSLDFNTLADNKTYTVQHCART